MVVFHAFTLRLPIQTSLSVAPELQVSLRSGENCEIFRKMMNGPEIPFTNVYTSSYIKGTAQYSVGTFASRLSSRAVGSTSRVAHSFGSDKLYICLSNKCFNCIQHICCVTDVRPSQDHRILRVQTVRINLAHPSVSCCRGPVGSLYHTCRCVA